MCDPISIGIAGYGAKELAKSMMPDMPKPPPPPPPAAQTPKQVRAAESAGMRSRRRAAMASGHQSTIMTSPLGTTSSAPTAKTVLGG